MISSVRLTLAVLLVCAPLVIFANGPLARSTSPPESIAFAGGPGKHPDIYTIAPDGSGRRRLTATPTDEYCPAWSPSGTRVAFTVVAGKRSWVEVTDARGRQLWRVPGVSCGEWSPDGTQILLARSNGVYVAAADSGRTRLLPIPIDSIGSWPVWSPDGRELAFVAAYSDDSDAAAARRLTMVVASADGTQTRDLVVQPPEWCNAFCRIYTSFLAWAPGKDIAFVLVEGDDYPERLYAIGEDGTGQRLLSGEPDDIYWPAWSPDGHRIAFTYRAGRQDQLWVADDQGGDVHKVSRVISRTSNLSGCFNPAWSSDGTRLVCWGHAGGLYIVNATTGASRRIARDAYIDYDSPASWRPVR